MMDEVGNSGHGYLEKSLENRVTEFRFYSVGPPEQFIFGRTLR